MECLYNSSQTYPEILYKSKHFPRRYKRKCEWVFLSENSVDRERRVTCWPSDRQRGRVADAVRNVQTPQTRLDEFVYSQ